MATQAKRRGPRRQDGEALEALTIRLTPKLRYGLELLARAQHRSLSHAIEWALNVGLNNYEVGVNGGGDPDTIGSVIDYAWDQNSASERALSIYHVSPILLSFEDAKTCELVEKSIEKKRCYEPAPDGLESDADWTSLKDLELSRRTAFYAFVAETWDEIRKQAVERAHAGKSIENLSLFQMVGLVTFYNYDDPFESMKDVTAALKAEDPKRAFKALAAKVSKRLDNKSHANALKLLAEDEQRVEAAKLKLGKKA